MKIVIKGGIWKNTEDEILKAAVMKYGKNQWARISSLLVRKTPKQCKARWYEWLDPSIKKTDWSREEDEKLLHLAKLIPTQWRTIAPIVGRTPFQCLERYQKLLDEAENSQLGLSLTDQEEIDASAPSADDIRKLRPGEIDPEPETKPARPDPVDMDEDEKEMISEARARLANTQGKKAKRRARGRLLEDSRRMVIIQKKRELKAAGIEVDEYDKYEKKYKGMDYNIDIPLERKPAPGFFDTTEELNKPVKSPDYKKMFLNEMEKPKKFQEEKENREKLLEKSAKNAKLQINELAENYRSLSSNRKKLELPQPQVDENQLQNLAKIGSKNQTLSDLVGIDVTEPTHQLVSEYNNGTHMLSTPLRTPRASEKEDRLKTEAQNQRIMTSSQTPLLGGTTDANIKPFDKDSTPKRTEAQTPNVLLQNLSSRASSTLINSSLKTPSSSNQMDQSPAHSNMEQADSVRNEENEQEIRQKMYKQLKEGFSKIPNPKNEFEIIIPETKKEDVTENKEIIEDAEERKKIAKEADKQRELNFYDKQSSVYKKKLCFVDLDNLYDARKALKDNMMFDDKDPSLKEAELLVIEECAKIMIIDKINNSEIANLKEEDIQLLEQYQDNRLNSNIELEKKAKMMIEEQAEKDRPIEISDLEPDVDMDNYDTITTEELLKARDLLENRMKEYSQRSNKINKKVEIKLGGYAKRNMNLQKEISQLIEELISVKDEYESLCFLEQNEAIGSDNRIKSLQNDIARLVSLENGYQSRYALLQEQKEEMLSNLNETIQ